MTFWIITASVAVLALALFALAWRSSGRAKPDRRPVGQPLTAAQEDHMTRSQGGGFGIGSIG